MNGDDVILLHDLSQLLTVWIGVCALVVYVNFRRRRQTGFLIYAYVVLFLLNHWFGALVHALPWSPFVDSVNTPIGFQESTYGLIALAVGALVMPSYRPRGQPDFEVRGAEDGPRRLSEARRIAQYYFFIGILSWIISYTSLAGVPGTAALISAGKQGLIFAICLKCWIGWRSGDKRKFAGWLAVSLAFPVVTTLGSGFLGYGIAIVITIFAFVSTFYRPRWRLVAAGIAAVYLGLSLYIAYAKTRDVLREVVWGGESVENRINVGLEMLANIESFSLWNESHLIFVNLRLNQNELVGAAIRYTPDVAPFLHGKTIYEAVLAIIPRAIWPDKPVIAGSGDYVSQQTGISFAEGTSIGMGQVLELYINFGTAGVVVGFLLLGMALRHIDDRLFGSMSRADWNGAALWFVVGTSALQVGGSLAEMSAAMMAAVVLTLASGYILRREQRKPATDRQRA